MSTHPAQQDPDGGFYDPIAEYLDAEAVVRGRTARHLALMQRRRAGDLRRRSVDLRVEASTLTEVLMTTLEAMPNGHQSEDWHRLSRRAAIILGRDPVIQDAKVVLARRYGITPAEAFQLLKHVSQTSHRKVAAVAAEVVGFQSSY